MHECTIMLVCMLGHFSPYNYAARTDTNSNLPSPFPTPPMQGMARSGRCSQGGRGPRATGHQLPQHWRKPDGGVRFACNLLDTFLYAPAFPLAYPSTLLHTRSPNASTRWTGTPHHATPAPRYPSTTLPQHHATPAPRYPSTTLP